MRIDLHHDVNDKGEVLSTHFIDTEWNLAPGNGAILGLKEPVTCLQYLALLNANPQLRQQGGWHEPSVMVANVPALHKWARVVAACNHINAPDDHKALKLKL